VKTPSFTKLALIATATAAATIASAATAQACCSTPPAEEDFTFVTPSGNIACDMFPSMPGAHCEIRDHTWVAPATTTGPFGRPCDFNFGGLQLWVDTGKPSGLGCYEGVSDFERHDLPTLDYGQTHSVGAITCDSEPSGVTCTDSSTGHFFRVSRESYQLG
jgi:hypothetical protein